mmetsp:Transcript_25679/g.36824  ORF Transcript_25679/g.36824 Transcript_25679/m.36824 type:complete len:258 (+) Transcript_25679:22-795(+)
MFLLFLYAFIGLWEVFAEYKNDVTMIRSLKPLLMTIASFWYIRLNKLEGHKISFTFLLGLVFAWLGDVFLLGSEDLYFMLGLGSFLIMQIIYIYCFRQLPHIPLMKTKIILMVLWICANWLIKDGVKELAIPVLVYSAVLCTMTLCSIESGHFIILKLKPIIESLFAAEKIRKITSPEAEQLSSNCRIISSCWNLEIGSVLFLLSDAVIGLCKFGIFTHSSRHQAFIMLTYIAAQGLIIHSFSICSVLITEENKRVD